MGKGKGRVKKAARKVPAQNVADLQEFYKPETDKHRVIKKQTRGLRQPPEFPL